MKSYFEDCKRHAEAISKKAGAAILLWETKNPSSPDKLLDMGEVVKGNFHEVLAMLGIAINHLVVKDKMPFEELMVYLREAIDRAREQMGEEA